MICPKELFPITLTVILLSPFWLAAKIWLAIRVRSKATDDDDRVLCFFCTDLLNYGGRGHTAGLHSTDKKIIDDLIDTGSRISSSTKSVLAAGAKKVYVAATHALLSKITCCMFLEIEDTMSPQPVELRR